MNDTAFASILSLSGAGAYEDAEPLFFKDLKLDWLLDRIQRPGVPFLSTYVKTTPVWRGSTGREK